MSKPEPFFFGDNDELFGMYHVANGARRRRAVLIAEPLLNENMRAHFALRQISMKLSAAGYDVLRFDYSGMGNSLDASDTAGPAAWKANLLTAANELQDVSGVSRLSIVAVRFSANLAASVTQTKPTEEFVMWDPVMTGKAWLEKLVMAQEATAQKFPYLDFDADREYLGHKMPRSFRDDLLATEEDAIVAEKVLRVETEDFSECSGAHEEHDVVKVPFQCNWESLSSQVLYPHKVIDEICKYLT